MQQFCGARGCWGSHARLSLITVWWAALLSFSPCPGSPARRGPHATQTPLSAPHAPSWAAGSGWERSCHSSSAAAVFGSSCPWTAQGPAWLRAGKGAPTKKREANASREKKQHRSTQLQNGKGTGASQVREQKHRAGHCWVPGTLQRGPDPPGPHPPLDKAGVKPVRSEVAGKGVNDLAHRGEVELALGLPCATRSCGAVAPAPCRAAGYWAMPTSRWENTGYRTGRCAVLDSPGCPLVDEGW